MTVEVLNPDGLVKPDMYRQVAIATGSRIVFLAGQVARDADGNPVGAGDLATQIEQALRNVNTAVTGAGGTFAESRSSPSTSPTGRPTRWRRWVRVWAEWSPR